MEQIISFPLPFSERVIGRRTLNLPKDFQKHFYYLPFCVVLACFNTLQIIIGIIPSWIRTNGTYQGTLIKDLSRVIQATK